MLIKNQVIEAENNLRTIANEVGWFKETLKCQLSPYYENETKKSKYKNVEDIPVPDISKFDCPYSRVVMQENLKPAERLVIVLALLPIVEPQALNPFFAINLQTGRSFAEFGGKADNHYGSYKPTLETAIFLLGGRYWAGRRKAVELFSPTSNSPVLKMLDMQRVADNEPIFRGILKLKKSYYSQIVEGKPYYPRFSNEFPASRLTTRLVWNDLVLNQSTVFDVEKILHWYKHRRTIAPSWNFEKRMRRGYRALFYGPPGTGKTLTATLMGQKLNKEVYRVDLSQVVSKYIGETEKNLANIFDQAEDKDWILFFDEADSIFGKRVNASSSNDQHSNQQVSYLLQRIENYPGIIILATNFRSNMDKAFARRFQSIIHFQAPKEETRLKLWQSNLPKELPLTEDVDIKEIAKKYKVTGGMIVNIIQYAIIESLAEGLDYMAETHFWDGIQNELAKEGK